MNHMPDPTIEQVLLKLPTPPQPTKMRVEDYVKLMKVLEKNLPKRIEVMRALNTYKRVCDKAGRDLKVALETILK
jgi:hypothetical protein